MAKRKELPKYTADELRKLKAALITHSRSLIDEIKDNAAAIESFNDAIELRDAAQRLSSTMLALSHIDLVIELAEHGQPKSLLSMNLDNCGLTWPIGDNRP